MGRNNLIRKILTFFFDQTSQKIEVSTKIFTYLEFQDFLSFASLKKAFRVGNQKRMRTPALRGNMSLEIARRIEGT